MAAAVHPTAPRTGLRGFLLGEKQAATTTTADRPRARAPGLWETGTFVSLPKALLHFRAPAFQIWSIELASPLGGHHTPHAISQAWRRGPWEQDVHFTAPRRVMGESELLARK